ncbi:TOM1-like protein 2 isoform X1 [Dendroctonus ponderosae]|uniref:TOM1-like protein 2 isoform X1 n=1 Tax=Dendroctonus ponderosae TaxID=77166 RepID=UPI002035E1CD|nr:TOM1-like protein 2 isoform X1 [Dendroctonus ponderosae]
MSFIQNALIGNPFSTPVGSKIEQATDASQASENWALNMEICDIINETEEGSKDAIRAIKKRLSQSAGKDYTVVMYTLTILETCVKNCGKRFHLLTCSKDFVQELVKLLSPKNDPPTVVQEKVLSLIQCWASAFQADQDLLGVNVVYKDLLAKGIEFPATDLDSLAPIHTPRKSVNLPEVVPASAPSPSGSPIPPLDSPNHTGTLTMEQRAKLQSELDVVQSNMNVLGEMLSEVKPGRGERDELDLLQELRAVCQSMQQRLMELISRITNDSLTEELLRINDDMNNLFLRYSRWEKNTVPSASAVIANAIPPTAVAKPALKNDDSLIDLDDDDLADTVNKLGLGDASNFSINAKKGTDEFDMFAQSRNVTYESAKSSGSTYKDNINPDQIPGGTSSATRAPETDEDRELNEMANWLGKTGGGEESVTSSDFERFLAERAAAAENLPTVSATTGPNNPSTLKKETKKKAEDLLA